MFILCLICVVTSKLDKIYEIVSTLKQDKNSKVGSKLSNTDYFCFAATTLDWPEEEDSDADRIVSGVVTYTTNLQKQAVDSNDISETKIVQPESRTFLKTLCEDLVKEEDRDKLTFGGGEDVTSSFLEYATLLQHSPMQEPYQVTGKTDATLMFCECPILVWEDKNLEQDLSNKAHCAQLLAELKGFAEKFKKHMRIEAPVMAGILTSGLSWRFAFRVFNDGAARFMITNIVKVSSNVCKSLAEVADCIDRSQITVVANMLVRCMKISMNLIDIIKECNKKFFVVSFEYGRGSDEGDDEADEDRDESDDDRKKDGDPPVEDFDKKINFSVQTSSKRQSNMSTKRAPFARLNENMLLTQENLFKHNLRSDTHGLFW